MGNIPIIGQVAKETAFLGQSAFDGFKFAVSGVTSAAQKTAAGFLGIASAISKLASGIKGAISKFSSLAKSMIGIKGTSKDMNTSFSGGLKTMLKYGLGIRSLYALFNKLRSAAVDAFKNLAQYSPEVNTSISSLKSSLDALENSLAVAFAPILNVAAPYLTVLIDMITAATNAIGRLFAALTGKSFAVQAKKNFSDYAAGVSKAGGAAKKAGKDVQKGIRAFDELKTISINDSEGGGGGGGGGGGISAADMFTEVPIEGEMLEFANKLKNAWSNADFTEIGTILGTKLKNALDNIEWAPIKQTAEKIGKSIATLINGFVEVDGLADSIGRTIGEAINTGIVGINAFLDNTHWDSVGKFIGEGLNGIVNTVDWEGLGHLFAAKWNAVFETLGSFADKFEWKDFGEKVGKGITKAISDFKWDRAGESLGKTVTGLLETLKSLIDNTNWKALGQGIATAISSFLGNVDWGTVGGTISSFATGILDFLTGLIQGVDWSGVPQGIIDGISDFFSGFDYAGVFGSVGGLIGASVAWGIDSAAATRKALADAWDGVVDYFKGYIEDSGGNIIQGLWNGIVDALKNVGEWIKENIFNPFIDGFKSAFGIASPSTVMEEQGIFIVQGLLNGINSLVQSVIDVFVEIKDRIISVWEETKENTEEKWNNIKEITTGLWEEIKNSSSEKFNGIKDGVIEAWNNIKESTTNIWNNIKEAVRGPINAIIGFINGMIDGVVGGINGMIEILNGVSFEIPDFVPKIGGQAFELNIPRVSSNVHISELAKGGLVMRYTPAVIGEAGMEAVLPLTNKHTMSMIADSIFENANHNTSDNFKPIGRTEELIAETRQQNRLLHRLFQEQNELLRAIYEKPALSDDTVFNSARRGQHKYQSRTWKTGWAGVD